MKKHLIGVVIIAEAWMLGLFVYAVSAWFKGEEFGFGIYVDMQASVCVPLVGLLLASTEARRILFVWGSVFVSIGCWLATGMGIIEY